MQFFFKLGANAGKARLAFLRKGLERGRKIVAVSNCGFVHIGAVDHGLGGQQPKFAPGGQKQVVSHANDVAGANTELPSKPKQLAAGGVIGIASAIFGIGGGSLTVPYLTRYGVVMQKAVGTSAACGLPIAIAGALGFMFFGMQQQVDVPNTIGFVHIYAFLGISIMSFFTAKLGAKVAHILSPEP